MGKFISLEGQRFERWTVLAEAERRKPCKRYWHCQCECGEKREVWGGSLANGDSKSCGCLKREKSLIRFTKHGQTAHKNGMTTPEYRAWKNAKTRCFSPQNNMYPSYGGRGITMCPEWVNDFSAFFGYLGPRPDGHTLDRIDNDGNYEPGNVQWASSTRQMRNRVSTVFVEYEGREYPMKDFAELMGIDYSRFYHYQRMRGHSVQESLRLCQLPKRR